MARKPSVILTKEERKELVASAKAAIKTAEAALKDLDKQAKAQTKAHEAALKQIVKDRVNTERQLEKARADLAKLLPARAEPSPVA